MDALKLASSERYRSSPLTVKMSEAFHEPNTIRQIVGKTERVAQSRTLQSIAGHCLEDELHSKNAHVHWTVAA